MTVSSCCSGYQTHLKAALPVEPLVLAQSAYSKVYTPETNSLFAPIAITNPPISLFNGGTGLLFSTIG